MKLIILFAFLAVSCAEDKDPNQPAFDDLLAAESINEAAGFKTAASTYNYVPTNQNNWYPPQNNWNPPQNTWNPPQNTWNPPQNTWTTAAPQNDYVPQNDYPSQPPNNWNNNWNNNQQYTTTTTAVPVIKNEQYYGDNGSYKYEYQIADGTHVGEEGYFTDPKATDESLVKKGWYSFTGADGKVYTVTYWADKTGFHAYGDHLPTPAPAIQAALDAQKQQQQQQQQQQQVYPTYSPTTQRPTYYPNYQQNYPNNQQTYPQSSYGK